MFYENRDLLTIYECLSSRRRLSSFHFCLLFQFLFFLSRPTSRASWWLASAASSPSSWSPSSSPSRWILSVTSYFFLNISTCFRCGCCPGRGPGPGTRTAPTTPPATAWTPWSPWPPGTRVSTRPACQTSGLFVTCRAHLSGRKWQTNDANSPWIVILPSLTIPEHKKCPVLTLIYQWMWLWLCPDEVRPQTRCQQHRMWGPQCQPPPALRGPDILHCGQEN